MGSYNRSKDTKKKKYLLNLIDRYDSPHGFGE
jgi:hypothetical protein